MKNPSKELQLQDSNCIITKEDCTSPMLAIKWARERHSIYLRRFVQKKDKPWTSDPYLSSYRFCNVYRELDTVSIWIKNNIIDPFEDDPSLWYKLCIARTINHIDTLQEFITNNAWKNPELMYKIMKARQERGEQVFTGAYIINSVFKDYHGNVPKEKAYYVAFLNFAPLLENRKQIQPHMKESMEAAISALRTQNGYGPFISYQVAVDLSYSSKWLKNAPDINTFNSPGPGTKRGLMRMFGGGTRGSFTRQPDEWYSEKILELFDLFQKQKYWKLTSNDPFTGFAPVSLSNISNICCESDKIARLFLGEGAPRSRYKGT